MTKQNELTQAVKVLKENLKADEELRYGYKANIAMCQYDAFYQYRKKNNKRALSMKEIALIANEGAENFLKMLCK